MSDGPDVYLFSYGALRQVQVRMATFSWLAITDSDVLAKSEARFHLIAEESAAPGDEVTGTVFEITEAELAAADDYEVSDYKRVAARLKSGLVA
jgi:hypothetical protein